MKLLKNFLNTSHYTSAIDEILKKLRKKNLDHTVNREHQKQYHQSIFKKRDQAL